MKRKRVKKKIALVDNGSVIPAATLDLRDIAKRLSEALGMLVDPVSMAHSDKVPREKIGGERAVLWRNYVAQSIVSGVQEIVVLPMFFGPSRALSYSLPRQFDKATKGAGTCSLKVAETLVRNSDPSDDQVARIASELIIEKLNTETNGERLPVVLVDHGSPSPETGRCRDLVRAQIEKLLGDQVESVTASSMERRKGSKYDFNEPLLENVLNDGLDTCHKAVCLSMMFLLPGKHAGEGGDIANIVSESEWVRAGKNVIQTDLIGRSDALIELLVSRFRRVIANEV